jgi:hypothetical protein
MQINCITCQYVVVQPLELVPGQDEPDEPRHVDEAALLDVADQVVGQVHAQEAGLGLEGERRQFF